MTTETIPTLKDANRNVNLEPCRNGHVHLEIRPQKVNAFQYVETALFLRMRIAIQVNCRDVRRDACQVL